MGGWAYVLRGRYRRTLRWDMDAMLAESLGGSPPWACCVRHRTPDSLLNSEPPKNGAFREVDESLTPVPTPADTDLGTHFHTPRVRLLASQKAERLGSGGPFDYSVSSLCGRLENWGTPRTRRRKNARRNECTN